MLHRIITTVLALGLAGSASAAVSFSFEAGQPAYNVAPNGSVQVAIYLKETLTEGSTSLITAEGGLFSFGINLDLTSGPGQISDLARNAAFDQRNPGSTTTFPADPALLWAEQNVNFPDGPMPDGQGRILLATLTFLAGGSASTTNFSIADFGPADQTVTYFANALDASISPGSFSIVTAIPEPAIGGLVLLAAPLLRRQRACR